MRKILSYIFPFRLNNYSSVINGDLEINLINGRKTLDNATCNFSYGSLQQILYLGLVDIDFPGNVERVLVLGLGGGSIIETIRDTFKSNVYIELVEIDSEMISIATNEFGINRFDNINIIKGDAIDYLENNQEMFDVIIVDIFVVDTIPESFTTQKTINSLLSHLTVHGKVIYNTMRQTMSRELFDQIKNNFLMTGLDVKVLEKVGGSNDLIIANK